MHTHFINKCTLVYTVYYSADVSREDSVKNGRLCQAVHRRYRIAGNFRGIQFSWFSRMTVEPRKLNPRNKKSNACAIRTGRGHNCWLAGARGVIGTTATSHQFVNVVEQLLCWERLS